MKWFGGASALLLLLGIAGWLALPLLPLPEGLSAAPPPSLELVDRTGRPLRVIREGDGAFAQRATFADIPQPLIDATLAAEDKRFWRHPGVDWRASLRAALDFVRHRRVVSGGSTITQQLIKLAQPRPRTLRTKLIEAAQALRLEQVWSKQRILTEYLNRLDYGNLNVGCAAAVQFYFGKPLRDLSVAEAALLAGLPQAPTRMNPHRHFTRAVKRQQWILSRMVSNGLLTAAEYERASQEALRLVSPRRSFEAPHFVDLVLEIESRAGVPPTSFFPSGERPKPLHTHTSLDLELNQLVERCLRQCVTRLRPQHVSQGAVVVLDNRTGEVLALAGSADFFAAEAGQVNGAWAARSAGSALKPFTYLLAFEQGATPATVVADLPAEFATPTGVFAPVNYNRRCYGPMRHRLALANSLNIAAVKVLASVGGPAVLRERLEECGLTTLSQSPDHYGLGLTIGNAEVRLLELVNAYACLARLGQFQPFRLTRRAEPPSPRPLAGGMPALRSDSESIRVFDSDAAWLIADILSDNDARALAFGAESQLRFDFPVACKTGTSSDFRDNWALGYTPEFTVGVWVGNFDGTPMERVSGVSGAAPVLHDVFEHLHQRFGTTWYPRPTNIVERAVHPVTGRLLAGAASGNLMEKFLAGKLPPFESAADYDAWGRVLLPSEYSSWLGTGDNWLAGRAVAAHAARALRLVSPLPGTVFFIDPDLPATSRQLPLKAEAGAAVAWSSDSLACRTGPHGPFACLAEGRHRLVARCEQTGAQAETWIEVRGL
jgi:penicillin-binding protein 1C